MRDGEKLKFVARPFGLRRAQLTSLWISIQIIGTCELFLFGIRRATVVRSYLITSISKYSSLPRKIVDR